MPLDTIKLPNSGYRATFKPDTYNESENTVDVIIATESEVVRRDGDGREFIEVLACSPDAVVADRLDGGNVSLVDTHDTYSVRSVLGRFIGYRFEGNTLVGTVLLATRDEVAGIVKDVRAGVIKNCSVGYEVLEAMFVGERADIPIIRLTKWQPVEVSLCAVNVDMRSAVRSDTIKDFTEISLPSKDEGENKDTQIQSITNTNEEMPETKTPAQNPEGNQPETPVTVPDTGTRAAIEAERYRTGEIMRRAQAAGLDAEATNKLIEDGTPLNEAYAKILDAYSGGQRSITPHAANITVGEDREKNGRVEAMTDALVLRAMSSERKNITGERLQRAEQYRGVTLLDLARMSAENAGINTRGLDKMELVKRAITSNSSDFPVLLEGTNRRVLLASYNAVADTWRRFCVVGSVGDFRPYKRLRMGSFSNLDALDENGEFKNKSIPDAEFESIQAETKGNIVNVSRKMIVNDDLNAFTRISSMLGRAAARSIESDVYAMFALNGGAGPVMEDGKTLFHADHGNIATTGGVPTVSIVDAMRVQMGQHKDPSGNDFLDIRPDIWLGPLSLGSTARILNTSVYDPNASNKLQLPNAVNGTFRDVIDTPRLSGTPWYMLANPNEEPVFEVCFLDGVETPFMETQQGFDVDGMRWKIRLDYGVGAIGYKGAMKNAGA